MARIQKHSAAQLDFWIVAFSKRWWNYYHRYLSYMSLSNSSCCQKGFNWKHIGTINKYRHASMWFRASELCTNRTNRRERADPLDSIVSNREVMGERIIIENDENVERSCWCFLLYANKPGGFLYLWNDLYFERSQLYEIQPLSKANLNF